jgi:site-specific recombinase
MPNSAIPVSTPSTVATSSLRDRILIFFPPEVRHAQAIWELATHFDAIAGAETLASRLDALVALIEWSRETTGVDADGGPDRSRLQMIVQVMDGVPEVSARVQDTFAEILTETEGVNLFGETGIPSDRGFLAELSDRLIARLLPQPTDEHDLSRLVTRLYATTDSVERLGSLPADFFHRMAVLFAPLDRPETWAPLQMAFADGFRLLAVRVEAEGLSGKLRARSHPTPVTLSPFHRMARISHRLMDAWRAGEDLADSVTGWHESAADVRAEIAEITRRLDTEGVSVDIVYGLEVLERCLKRMEHMLEVVLAPSALERGEGIHGLMLELVEAAHKDRSIRHLLRTNMKLLQRKIVDRSGKTGEHYVAQSSRAYRAIWYAAAGGGLLTVITAAVKLKVAHAGFPLFLEGLVAGLNYAVSFMLLHHFHLVLATKQPAMTAATLAALLRNRDRTARLDSVVEFTVQIVRSQVAAATANVIFVFLGAFLFSYLWSLMLGRSYLSTEDAQHVFETLSPVNSGTVFYAALTGVILWMAAMIGGWFDNWAVYHRLPQAIADHKLGSRFGRPRMARAAGVISRNMAGWGTNISLGFMLGMAPVFGKFLGLPIDVRHVTLSSGMLAFGASGLEDWFTRGWFLWALAGVATMFVLNLSVSFLLSLYTASRAYDLGARELGVLGARLLRRFVERPIDFVLPGRNGEQSRDGRDGRDDVT